MSAHRSLTRPGSRRITRALVFGLAALAGVARAQQISPPGTLDQLRNVIGDRVEALTILGGDQGASRGIYSFRGGAAANFDLTKIGGGGDVAKPRAFGSGSIRWAPVLQGNLGWISADNKLPAGVLAGNRLHVQTFAALVGGGARLYLSERASIATLVSGIYGKTESDFKARNEAGEAFETAFGRFVDGQVETWSIVPAAEFKYAWPRGRVRVEFISHYGFFHTESFHGSSGVVQVDGDSQTWENRIDIEAPLGWHVFGCELESGGFVSRTDLAGRAAEGLNASHFETINGRFVLDLTDKVWKTRWLGLGASWFHGERFTGWSAGLELRFAL